MATTTLNTTNRVIENLSVNREIERHLHRFISSEHEVEFVFICTSSGEPIATFENPNSDNKSSAELLFKVSKIVAAMQSTIRTRLNKDRVKSTILETELHHVFVTPLQIKTRGAYVCSVFSSEVTLGMAEYKSKQIVQMLSEI